MGRILVVDDDPAAVTGTVDALGAHGFDVDVAGTAADGLEAARRLRPDAVVLEGMLDGGLGGFGLARRLADEFPRLPLVMVTRADAMLSDGELASQDVDGGWLPVARYLEKPVMPSVLADEVGHLVGGD
jgi:CheY-like chemotaxis protein